MDDLRVIAPRLDLGVRALVPEWARLAAKAELGRDLAQGAQLAAIMIPLSLWLAVVSSVPPETGIVTAAVGSAVCVLFGGTHVALSGPGLFTALLVSRIAHQHGMAAVGAVVVLCGVLQVVTGTLGLGRFVRLAPVSIVRGVVVGMGAMMLLLQLPAVLGGPLAPDTPALERIDHFGAQVPHTNLLALGIATASVLFAVAIPRAWGRAVGALLGVALPTALVGVLGLDVPTLDSGALPSFAFPTLPSSGVAQLGATAIALWLTASLGTLMSTAAVEKLGGRRTDPDQELIGNGLASVLLGFVGCLPATHLVARSAVALRLGATARRAALVQAVVVLVVGLAAWPVLEHVPIAALTGVVVLTAGPLLDPRPLRDVGRIARFEVAIGALTAAVVALFGIVQGLETGLAIALVAATFRLARTRALLHVADGEDAHQVTFSGPVTFLATLELERLRDSLARIDAKKGVVFDLRSVVSIDATGAQVLIGVVREVLARDGRAALLGPSARCRERLVAADPEMAALVAPSARELEPILEKAAGSLGRRHLLAGLVRFREEQREHYDSLFEQLADGQHPHTMFITCADSRVSPGQMMGAHPGDLFIVRCIGALVPPSGSETMPQEGAALEYGVGVLGVRHVIVCGHSRCGAVAALRKGEVPAELASLGTWSRHAAPVAGEVASFADADEAARAVTVRQLEHLKSYPLVRERIEKGELHVHAWFYDLGKVELYEWNEAKGAFAVVGEASG